MNVYTLGMGLTQSNEYSYDIEPMSTRTLNSIKGMKETSKQSLKNENVIFEDEREVNYSSSSSHRSPRESHVKPEYLYVPQSVQSN